MLLLVACAIEERVIKDTWGDFHKQATGKDFRYSERESEQSKRMSGQRKMDTANQEPTVLNTPQSQSFWAILLTSFTGLDQQKQATDLIAKLKRSYVTDAWLSQKDGYTHVYRGKFSDPTTPKIQSMLRQSKMIKLGNNRPFTQARIKAARPAFEVSSSDMDLKRYRQQKLWSLQIAVYDDVAGLNYKQLAEQAATNLRQDGDRAFFYHGPHRSMVTIGLYTYDQAWTQRVNIGDTYSPLIRQLQEKYPFNLYNSRTIIEKVGGKKVREQPSFLVKVK